MREGRHHATVSALMASFSLSLSLSPSPLYLSLSLSLSFFLSLSLSALSLSHLSYMQLNGQLDSRPQQGTLHSLHT